MSKKNAVAGQPGLDPTLPNVELTLGDKTYQLVFTFGALATASAKLRAKGIQVNLLHSLDLTALDADRVGPLLFAALLTHQPKIDIEEVEAKITMFNLGTIFEKIVEAYSASLADNTQKSGTEGKA